MYFVSHSQIDYASRDCQEMFYKKMEQTGQLRPGERPDARSMQKKIAENPHWDDGGYVYFIL
jgi:hypothetical protein